MLKSKKKTITQYGSASDSGHDWFICLEQQIKSQSSSSQGFVTLSSRPHSEQVYAWPSAIFPIEYLRRDCYYNFSALE